MFKPHYGTCVNPECKKENVIIPVKSGICERCNYDNKQLKKRVLRGIGTISNIHQGRDEEGYGGGSGTEGFIRVGSTPKMVRQPIKKSSIQHRRKPSGEKEVFERIWEENTKNGEAKCFVCNKVITEPTASNFAHILPKALNKYPLFKLHYSNIKLFCHDSYGSCHHRFDHEPRSSLKEPMWGKVFELEKQLKEEYIILKSK